MGKGTLSPVDRNSFTALWKGLSGVDKFLQNERRDIFDALAGIEKIYSQEVQTQQRKRLESGWDKVRAAAVHQYRTEAAAFANAQHERVTKAVRTAPTQSMLNLLETLRLRDDLDAVELHDMLPVFFGNANAMRALQCIAKQNGISLNMPVQFDCASLHKTIDDAKAYLLGACDELGKPSRQKNIKYHAFFFQDPADPAHISDPVFQEYVDMLDYIPQLSDVKPEKTGLSPFERAKIEWYYNGLENATTAQIDARTREILAHHPEDIGILKLSQYADSVAVVEEAERSAG